jgi:U4/U6 small nuclear ribonucleoprotein PRP3
LDALKQRIAESAKKAGLNSEFETLEKNIRACLFLRARFLLILILCLPPQREPPPVAEWWDVSLLPNKTYDDLAQGLSYTNIRAGDSPITLYVQHPIPIPAPWDKFAVEVKALKLTKKVRAMQLVRG